MKTCVERPLKNTCISTLVNRMDPDQLACLENSVDPYQLATEEAS